MTPGTGGVGRACSMCISTKIFLLEIIDFTALYISAIINIKIIQNVMNFIEYTLSWYTYSEIYQYGDDRRYPINIVE